MEKGFRQTSQNLKQNEILIDQVKNLLTIKQDRPKSRFEYLFSIINLVKLKIMLSVFVHFIDS